MKFLLPIFPFSNLARTHQGSTSGAVRAAVYTTLIVTIGMSVISGPAFANETGDRAKLEELKKNIAALKEELEQTKSSRDKLQKDLETTEKNIGELNEKAREIREQMDQGQEKLKDLNDERSELDSKKKSQQNYVGQHMKSAWRMGQQGNIRLLLNQQDPSRVARNLKYYDYVIKARAEKISAYMQTIDRINQIEPEIAHQTQQLQTNHNRLQVQREALRQSQSQRKKLLDELVADIQSKDSQLSSLQTDRTRLQRLLSNVKQFLNDAELPNNAENFAGLKGKLPWPARGKVLHNFGTSRVGNRLKWEGMLIQATTGSPVIAVHHGRVVFSDYLRGHGLLIVVDHGASYMTLYAHNEVLYKEIGEWVNSGETIATVGTSGGQQNSALYFELRHKGEPTNPRAWFKAA